MSRFPSFSLGRGDPWHSTDRCHSALLSRKAANLPFPGSRGAFPNRPWAFNAVMVPRPQIWGRCNSHDLYPVCLRILHAAVCPDGVLLDTPPFSRRGAASIGHVSFRRRQKCRRQTREPQSLFKPPASRMCPVRHSARPPRPSDKR